MNGVEYRQLNDIKMQVLEKRHLSETTNKHCLFVMKPSRTDSTPAHINNDGHKKTATP